MDIEQPPTEARYERPDGPPADAAVRARLVAVFDHAFTIERFDAAGPPRWVAVPAL